MALAYQRPEPSPAEVEECTQLTGKITNGRSMRDIRVTLAAILVENVRLTREVNQHRLARGFDPLPIYHAVH